MSRVRYAAAVEDTADLFAQTPGPCPHCRAPSELLSRSKSRSMTSAVFYRIDCTYAGKGCKGANTSWELTEWKARKTWRTLTRRMRSTNDGI